MLKVKIETEKPEYCVARKYPDAIFRIKCVCRGENGIKAFVDLKLPNSKTIFVIDEYKCPLAQKILDSGVVVLSAEIREKIVWNLACSNDSFKKLMNSLDCELISKEKFSENAAMTYKEYKILKFAFEKGFFDTPKKITLEEIAKTYGCSKSTASETIRRGLKVVLKMFFD